ncbi:MAG TPA: hypothetical protein VK670_06545, partial [Silvibacterium sp.]|nr:hypothetical protein [Silvibacterium sp.]
ALEPFRNEILNLFQSTYLLDSLDGQGLRDAIEKPVEFFGGEYEHELTEQLVADLSASEDREAMATSKAAVDLPMMQIICERLWKVVENRDPKRLTLALYKKELGGKDKILETYVHEVMPRSWSDKLLTARLMRLLAPASGLKKPYTAAELASNDGLNEQRVTAELERLEEQRILKEKEYRGQKLYELQHDAFVRFISPWRDDILRQERMRRRLSRLGLAVGVVLAFAAYYVFSGLWHDRNLMDALAHESQQEWRENAVMSFDSATTDLLFRWKMFGLLNYWLHRYEKQIPVDYGLANAPWRAGTHTGAEAAHSGGTERCDFLCVHYSEGSAEDEDYINVEWRSLATSYFASRGIPVPTKLQFKPESNYGSSHFAVTFGKQLQDQTWPETVLDNRKIPINDDTVFLSRGNLRGPAADFFDRYHRRWNAVPADDTAPFGPYTIVPGWLRPVWKVSGSPATDIRGLPAIYLASALLKNPEPLFGKDAMQVLLANARKKYPQTVSEALAARGYDNLRKDLAQLVSTKHGESLTNLPMILDALTAYPSSDPANTPEAVADKVSADLHQAEAKIPARLVGPWKGENTEVGDQTPSDDYTEIQSYIPELQLSVQVYMGKGLQDIWFNDKTPILNPRLSELRDKLLARYGVELRPPLFYTPDVSDPLPSTGYRIETVASRAQQCQVPALRLANPSDADIDHFLDTIEKCIVAARVYWVMAEDANAQRQRTSPAAAAWLSSHYSLSDQKFLMRAIFAGPVSEAPNADRLPPEYSLRHAGWLMRSLVFWTHADDPHDTMRLAASLRETQRARLKPVSSGDSNPAVARLVAAGISALLADQMSAAEADFIKAIAMDRAAAEHEFLSLYPGSLKVIKLRQAATFCNAKDPPYRDTGTQATQDLVYKRIDLQETLDQWKGDLTPDQIKRYGLCLLSSYRGYHRDQVEISSTLVKRYSNPADWTPEEARWLGEEILHEYDPYRDSTAFRDGGTVLIKSAVLRLPEAESRKVFGFVEGDSDVFTLNKMDGPGPRTWRLALLRELMDAPNEDPENLLDFAIQLYQIDRKEPLEEALRIMDRASKAIENEPDAKQRERETALVYYYRASALERLSDLGMIDPSLHLPDRRAEADQNLEHLKRINAFWAEHATTTESEFVSERGDYAKAIQLSRESMSLYHTEAKVDASWYEVLLTSQLLANDPKGIAETAKLAQDEANELKRTMDFSTETEEASLMFTAALGQLVTGSEMMEETGRDFLTRDHPYVPYVAMMLYARIA